MTDTNLFYFVYSFLAFAFTTLGVFCVVFVFRDSMLSGIFALISFFKRSEPAKEKRKYYGPSNLVKD